MAGGAAAAKMGVQAANDLTVIGGNLLGGIMKTKNDLHRQRDWARFQFQLDQQKYEGEKNALLSAGFNPAAATGGGAQTVASSSPGQWSGGATSTKMDGPAEMRALKAQAESLEKDIDVKQSNIEANKAAAAKANAEANLTQAEATARDLENKGNQEFQRLNGTPYTFQQYGILQQVNESMSRKYGQDIDNSNAQRVYDDQHEEVLSKIGINKAEEDRIKTQKDIDLKMLPANIALLYAQAYKANKEGTLAQHQMDLVDETVRKTEVEIKKLRKEALNAGLNHELIMAQIGKCQSEQDLINVQESLEEQYGGSERFMRIITGYFSCFANVGNAISNAVNAGANVDKAKSFGKMGDAAKENARANSTNAATNARNANTNAVNAHTNAERLELDKKYFNSGRTRSNNGSHPIRGFSQGGNNNHPQSVFHGVNEGNNYWIFGAD